MELPLLIKYRISSIKLQILKLYCKQMYEQDQYDEEEDDLFMFDQQNRIQKLKDVGVNVEAQNYHDPTAKLNQFFTQQNSSIQQLTNNNKFTPKKNQLTEQELSARKLRLHNAAKYFQTLKLAYLKDVHEAIKIPKNQSISIILSMLPMHLLVKYQQLRATNPFSIKIQKILKFLSSVLKSFKQSSIKTLQITKGQIVWIICKSLRIQVRKVKFFDLCEHVDQTFYNLNFDKNKKKHKKVTKNVDQIKNKIQRKIDEEISSNTQDFVNLQDFSLTSATQGNKQNNNKPQGEFKVLKSKQILNRNLSIRKNYKESTFQLFSYAQNKWIMFFCHDDLQFNEIQIEWFKQNILNGQPVVGFYSIQQLDVEPQYQDIFKLRKMGKIVIRDLTIYFADKIKELTKRRQRVGIRIIMNKIFRFCKFYQPVELLTQQCQYAFKKSKQIDEELLRNQMPTSNLQLSMSDYFVIPSKIGKYFSLHPNSQPAIQNFYIDEQKIYWKDDLLALGSRMGWIDFGRMVKQNEIPLKKTQNKNKKPIQLYRYQQTEPYELKIDEQGDFILDSEHFSIYIPPNLKFPQNTCIIHTNIGFICNKHKFKHAKLVQGFVNSGMRVLPNQIGYLVYENDKQDILKFHKERQAMLNTNKQTRQGENIQKMWKQLFKSLRLMDRLSL